MGGMGEERNRTMYHFIEDKEFQGKLYSTCSDIVNQLKQAINNDDALYVETYLIGSGARKLITQNANEPVDLDFNLCILESYDFNINDGKSIKDYVMEVFDDVLENNGWRNCKDSTSVITTEQRYFTKGNDTAFSIDLGILKYENGRYYRLIHNKTGIVNWDQYYWNEVPHSNGLTERADIIKENDLWEEVRQAYLNKKNMYLSRQDRNHPSFIVYVEAVNEIYYKYF